MRAPALACALAVLACRPSAPQPEAPAAKDPVKGADLEDSCGRGQETFDGFAWVPTDARMVASFRLDAADLDPALGQLEALVRGEDHGLPITVGFSLSQLRLEVSLLRAQLAAAGFNPAELARLGAPDGTPVWVFPTSCDLAEAKLRAGAAWKLDLRITTDGTIGEPRPPASESDTSFPHAVQFLRGDRIALVPAAAPASIRSWLRGNAPPAGEAPEDPPGARLDAVTAAPARIVLGGRALLSGDDAGDMPRVLRVTANGVEIDGSLRSSP